MSAKIDIFNFDNYKNYLRARISDPNRAKRGYHGRLAKIIGSQPSYLSQILNGKPDLQPEQVIPVNDFLGHTELEGRYLLHLVHMARAGTPALRSFYSKELSELKKQRFHIKKRLSGHQELSDEHKSKYYSSWVFSAVHMFLAVETKQDLEYIASQLNLPLKSVAEAVDFLLEAGLIELKKGIYKFTKQSIYLGKDSDHISRHHMNWRCQSLQSVEKNLPDDLHISHLMALSSIDLERVREQLVQAFLKVTKTVETSTPEEKVAVLTLDLYELSGEKE